MGYMYLGTYTFFMTDALFLIERMARLSLLVLAVVMAYYMIFTDTAMRLTPYILLSFVPILILFVLCVII